MDVSGQTVIYAKSFGDRIQYSRSIAFKDADGTWHRIYEPVTFRGGDPGIVDGSRINVRKAFESGYVGRHGDGRKLVVMEWDIANGPKEARREEDPGDTFAMIDEDLPF